MLSTRKFAGLSNIVHKMAEIGRGLIVRCAFPDIPPEFLEGLVNLGQNFHLDELHFGYEIEALQMNLEQKLNQMREKKKNPYDQSVLEAFRKQLAKNDGGRNKENRVENLPPVPIPRNSVSEFSQRTDRGKVLAELVGPAATEVPRCPVSFELLSTIPKGYFRNEGKVALNTRLTDFKDLFEEIYQKEIEPRLTRMSEVPLTVVGRVVSEDGGKLSAANLALQDKSDQVELDVTGISDFLLYPGKIISAVGSCNSLRFQVTELLPSIASPLYHHEEQGLPLNLIVACGPFSCNDDLDYEPLTDLLTVVKQEKCSCLVLCGPFLDCEHPHFKEDLCPYSAIFGADYNYQEAMDRLMQHVLSKISPCDLIIVPSTQDLAQLSPLPQQPYTCPSGFSAHMTPNPCLFTANGYLIGISTADVIKEISTGSFARNTQPVNRIKQAFGEILEQRSFQPFCPSDTPVDLQHLEGLHLSSSPDLLIIPSKMARILDSVGTTLCANPGPLTKGKEAGAYLRVQIAPGSGSVKERTQLHLIQI